MGAALFGFRPAQAVPCLFHRLGLLLDFLEPALNAAQLFKHGLKLRENPVDFAHGTTSFIVVIGIYPFLRDRGNLNQAQA